MPLYPLFLSIVLYGLLSHPAPPSVRWVEAAVGCLLLAVTGVRRPASLLSGHAAAVAGDGWTCAMALSFLWLAWAPLLRGLSLGWDGVMRDVVPLGFLFLPLMLVPPLRAHRARAVRILVAALALAGVLFAVRWWNQNGWAFGLVGGVPLGDGPRYFLNAPSVLFAGIGLTLAGAGALAGRMRGGGPAAVAGLAGGLLCLGALAGAVHRLALVLAVCALTWAAVRQARGLVLAAAAAALLALMVEGSLPAALAQAWEKSRIYGVNARGAELDAVLVQAGDGPWPLLFGQGWGALLANPAVGGWRVGYTHTLVSYALFKAGILGLAALTVYLLGALRAVPGLVRRHPVLAAAVLPPLAVSLTLHTSFKYLDCGLLLTLLVLAGEDEGKAPVTAPRTAVPPSCRPSAAPP
ncbi:hypothetical protein M2352_003534 [Azospirillum fermentarium]|uniref:hypothetical protein n=1 Tax=Azospirillum fermentarium TaxID=1233114 RepID=UPI002225D6D8|nr:hypothetical protein [Azospirillum fermentarium]MCW2247900.1 hypothetical protein [Azospirillum fermentarium]